MKALFELEWNDDLGKGWMNQWNLELCLYSKEHTRKDLIRVREVHENPELLEDKE